MKYEYIFQHTIAELILRFKYAFPIKIYSESVVNSYWLDIRATWFVGPEDTIVDEAMYKLLKINSAGWEIYPTLFLTLLFCSVTWVDQWYSLSLFKLRSKCIPAVLHL